MRNESGGPRVRNRSPKRIDQAKSLVQGRGASTDAAWLHGREQRSLKSVQLCFLRFELRMHFRKRINEMR